MIHYPELLSTKKVCPSWGTSLKLVVMVSKEDTWTLSSGKFGLETPRQSWKERKSRLSIASGLSTPFDCDDLETALSEEDRKGSRNSSDSEDLLLEPKKSPKSEENV